MRLLAAPGMLLFAGLLSIAQAERPPEPAAPRNEYLIGVEDLLRISVWGESSLNQQVRVRPDGKISYPLVNEIVVDGMTPEQLRQELTSRLAKFIRDPNVTVVVDEVNSFRVYVLGQVRSQGAINFKRPTRILQAIAAAGGLTDFAKREVVLIRDQAGTERRIRVDYRKLVSGEGTQENILLKPGDTILVE